METIPSGPFSRQAGLSLASIVSLFSSTIIWMNGTLQFDIDDDSPEIAYFPRVNLEPSPNVTAGWQLLYSISGAATSPGQLGLGSSYHYTSLSGASFVINWTGTGVDLLGSVSNALYNISLDGLPSPFVADPANTILASFHDLENTNHSLLLTTTITNATSPNAFLTFDKARITYAPPPQLAKSASLMTIDLISTTATSQAITDADIAFMGSWSYIADSAGNSMHVSNSAGDRAELSFVGSAITIYGLTSSYSGNFSVTLDNTTTNLSALSSYNNSDTLLFYATDLSIDTAHQLVVTNQENRNLALRVGGVNITSFTNGTTPASLSSSNSIPPGDIAAAVLGAVLFLVAVCVLYYACSAWRKSRASAINERGPLRGVRRQSNEKSAVDVERVPDICQSSREELESTSLSTSKGYGFGLGLGRGFPFAYRKNNLASSSSVLRNGVQTESHQMTPQRDRDEKPLQFAVFESPPHAPESEKLAPGWCNPVARTSRPRRYKSTRGVLLPELHAESMGRPLDDDDDDADIKTLTSRQDEALAATLLLSPRTSEALPPFNEPDPPKIDISAPVGTSQPEGNQQPDFLRVRETSPFSVDMSTVFGARRGNHDSGSGSSTWSKVRTRLYRQAHRDDGRQSHITDRQESSSSSGPESVPVLMHESSPVDPPSETALGSGTYSFLDFASSHASLRQHSKTTTLGSVPTEFGNGAGDISPWSETTSTRNTGMKRSRNDVVQKPDAPSTVSVSDGSHPSDNSGVHTVPSAPTMHTHRSSTFPFPITLPASTHIVPPTTPPSPHVPERHVTSLPPDTPSARLDQSLQVPPFASPEFAHVPNSPTESVPFSVSEIHFRNSYSDYAGPDDSQRASVSSFLPPHPPLPLPDGSQNTTPPPPPYIVQRVLGLPLSPLSPFALPTPRMSPEDYSIHTTGRPGIPPVRVGSLLGPRPRPLSVAGSSRGSAPPQLPMQGGRGSSRGPR